MISEYGKNDCSEILYVINDAAEKYRNVIPDNCWKEPYMSESELLEVFEEGVKMFGYVQDNKLISVMGFQETMDVVLIRHAYTLTEHQGKGTGSTLLKYLLNRNKEKKIIVLDIDDDRSLQTYFFQNY